MAHTNEVIKEIKQSFRLRMNGVASLSMRNRGVGYKLNWGIPFDDLKQMAEEYERDYELAALLWKEDIRECKILATLLMPADQMDAELAELWMQQTSTQEIAEMAAFNLFQHLSYAPELALRWMAVEKTYYQICAFNMMARLFNQGLVLADETTNEFINLAERAIRNGSLAVRHAALNCLRNFMKCGPQYEEVAAKTLKSLDLSFFC